MGNVIKDLNMAPGEADGISVMEITEYEFKKIKHLVNEYFGINLSDEKKTLVVGRLQRYLKRNHYKSFSEYIDNVEADVSGDTLSTLIDRISTNHTFFFREYEHFDFLSRFVLPGIEERLKRQRSRDVRIWCAGCSGGDEAYSIAIVLMEYFRDRYRTFDAGLLATDISEKMLIEARKGVYPDKRLFHVPARYKLKYFMEIPGGRYEVNSDLKREVVFRRLNLTNRNFPFKKSFDVISCRNVMIYFDTETRDRLVKNLYHHTSPGGYLFVGLSESLNVNKYHYSYIQPGIYQKGFA